MYKYILLFFLLSSLAQADDQNCDEAKTTAEINLCVADKLELAEKKMRVYLQTSIDHHRDDIVVAESIKQAQRAWVKYMELHCDSIYSLWREGSIRNVMSLGCQITLTQERTYELWSQYLRPTDDSTPLLPDPEPTKE